MRRHVEKAVEVSLGFLVVVASIAVAVLLTEITIESIIKIKGLL